MSEEQSTGISDASAMTAKLVDALRDGQADAAGLFNQIYRDSLLRFCWGYLGSMDEAEDALQDILYKVLTDKHIPDYFRPWVYKVSRNHCLNMLRDRARRHDGVALPSDSMIFESITGHLTRLVKDEMRSKLTELVMELPEGQREVLRLRYVEELSRVEIAEVLELAESVVKSRLFEGLQKLRSISQDLG